MEFKLFLCFAIAILWHACSAQPCYKTGCSGQLCADEHITTDCIFKLHFICYRNATCARSDTGQCAWHQTDSFKNCLNDHGKKGKFLGQSCGTSTDGTDYCDVSFICDETQRVCVRQVQSVTEDPPACSCDNESVCENNLCVPIEGHVCDGFSASPFLCPAGFRCNQTNVTDIPGRCIRVGLSNSSCSRDAECGDGSMCQNYHCVSVEGHPCGGVVSTFQCPSGYSCVTRPLVADAGGTCVANNCSTDAECGAKSRCVSGFCSLSTAGVHAEVGDTGGRLAIPGITRPPLVDVRHPPLVALLLAIIREIGEWIGLFVTASQG